jgi:hypothetical protein
MSFSLSSTYHTSSYLDSRVDIFSFSLLIKSLAISKCLGDRVINAHKNYDIFCIVSVLRLSSNDKGLPFQHYKLLFPTFLLSNL